MNKFKNYRAITRFAGFVIVLIAALLVSPSIRPQDEQCEVLKERIINPKNNYEKNQRYYYCEQMKDRKCPDYKSLCEDSNDKGDKGVSVTTPDISGSWAT